jgi:hypothetical protein
MRILLLDIETAPNRAFVWGFWEQNVSPSQLIESSYVLCWSAQWYGEKKILFDSVQKSKPATMLGRMHRLLDEADAVVHFNGKKFDIPVLNKEFLKHGFKPPSPYKQIDLMQVCKYAFRFESNSLAYVAQSLKLGAKVKHQGFELWVRCMDGDKDAWRTMERYNRGDVRLLEKLYRRLVPWCDKHPSHGAFEDIACCPKCGSEKFQQRGFAVTQVMKYRRYQCLGCGGWFRGNKSVSIRISERHTNIAA